MLNTLIINDKQDANEEKQRNSHLSFSDTPLFDIALNIIFISGTDRQNDAIRQNEFRPLEYLNML